MKASAVLVLISSAAAAYEQYCPWWPEAQRRGVKLKAAYEDVIGKGQVIRRDGFALTNSDDCFLRVRAQQWSMEVPDACTFRAAYVFDFDGNGKKDLLLRLGTGAVGSRPTTELVAILIDSDGQPHFSRWSLFSEGVLVTDFDGDGRYELIDSGYGGSKRDKHHYWFFVLYEARGAEWYRVDGKHGPIESPQYTWYTQRDNRKPVQFARGDEPETGNLSTAPKKQGLVATSIRWRYGNGGPHTIEFSDGSRCELFDGADTILARGSHYQWTKPTEWLLKQGSLDVVMQDETGSCHILRVVVRVKATGAK